MKRFMAPCGLICNECEAYQATQLNDVEAIAEVAIKWNKRYGIAFSPDEIWCDGCTSDSERTAHHTRECPIRPCLRRRGITSCAECDEYRCKELIRLHRLVPEAQKALEVSRSGEDEL